MGTVPAGACPIFMLRKTGGDEREEGPCYPVAEAFEK